MANIFTPSIEGDGINFTFFRNLWHKNKNEDKRSPCKNYCKRKNVVIDPIRLPDTVIFQLGQPLQWYFTSERGGQPIILRKRKQNVNIEKIEEEFLKKGKISNNGYLSQNDIIAYFIASSDCTSRNRKNETQINEADASEVKISNKSDPFVHCLNSEDEITVEESFCDIEYFNEESLREFLYRTRKHQSGILQRFIEPSGGGTHNSQIRAICTPKLCVLERRKTKQDLHDSRFGLYERAVTFEGPDVHSSSLPLRGEALPGKLRSLCKKVLNHISDTTRFSHSLCRKDVRMVLNLKVDSKDRIWILYSSSIRSVLSSEKFPSMNTVEVQNDAGTSSILNLQDIIKLSPKIKLNQEAKHDPFAEISNKMENEFCPSCGMIQSRETFHPVPYKTIITHFEQVMKKSGNRWPPIQDIVIAAGGMGFGKMLQETTVTSEEEVEEEKVLIPPIIRSFHKRLKAEGYRRYRSDPLFLHKHCDLCEGCFLSYANLVNSSFQIKVPINLDTKMKHLGFGSKNSCHTTEVKVQRQEKRKVCSKKEENSKTISSFCSDIVLSLPTFPRAIVEPPVRDIDIAKDELMSIPYERIESPNQPLMHLIKMYEAIEKSRMNSNNVKHTNVKTNPYETPLKFVDGSSLTKKRLKSMSNKIQYSDYIVPEQTNAEQDKKHPFVTVDYDKSTFLSNTLAKMTLEDKLAQEVALLTKRKHVT